MSGLFDSMKQNPLFWEIAFILAIFLLIGAHKISVEGMIG